MDPPFHGIRFLLIGFTPLVHDQYKTKLISLGGADAGKYSTKCTHVIVHHIPYDDPICVAARNDGKILVSSLWLEHSLDMQGPTDVSSILYRPLRDLNGIPGANKLVICVTGYYRQEREDLMTMVSLMGAEFSKPLNATRVTHLICYKFEGEKFDLAYKVGIKLVNHLWVEDSLKAWEILPEDRYNKSSYQLEMMEAEVKDSEEETGDIAPQIVEGRNINGISNLQNDVGKACDQSAAANRVPTSSLQQGFPNYVSFNDVKLPMKSEPPSESRSLHKMDKPSLASHNENVKNVRILPSNQIGNNPTSTTGKIRNSSDSDAEKFSTLGCSRKTPVKSNLSSHLGENPGSVNGPTTKSSADSPNGYSSPSSSKRTPGRPTVSMQSSGKSGKSVGRPVECLVRDDVQISNLLADRWKATSPSASSPNSKRLFDVDAGKSTPGSSSKSPRRSSLSMQSAGRLSLSGERLKENLAEKGNANGCAPNRKADEEKSGSGAEFGLLDGNFPAGSLPQKRVVGGKVNIAHTTPKSHKLNASASKRIDAAGPVSPVSSPLGKGSLNPGSQVRNETSRPSAEESSPDISSIKSNRKNITSSRSLPFEELQGSKSKNMNALSSPTTSDAATCASVSIKKAQPQNQQEHAFSAPDISDLEAAKSGSPKLNSDEQIDNSVSKPPRKKMVARKALGSRSKLSKSNADAQKTSAIGSSSRSDATIHTVGSVEGEDHANLSVAHKIMAAISKIAPKRPCLKSGNEVNDAEHLDDETETLADLEVQHEKSAADLSRLSKTRTMETSEVLLCQTDEAEVTNPPFARQEMPAAGKASGMEHAKLMLIPQKKGISGRTKRKNITSAPKDAAKSSDDAEGTKGSDEKERVKGQTAAAAAKKRRGSQLMKGTVEAEKENSHVACDDQGTSNGEKGNGNLALKKRRGTSLLNKSSNPFEMKKENKAISDEEEGQKDGEELPDKLAGMSDLMEGPMVVEDQNIPATVNGQGKTKGGGRTGKLAGKKRRGTLLLSKSEGPVAAEEESAPGFDGNPEKLPSPTNLTEGPVDLDKENDPVVGNDQGTRNKKLSRKKRRGTLLLNESEGSDEVENENEPVIDDDNVKSKGQGLSKSLASKSNMAVRKKDAVESDPLIIQCDLSAVKHEPACFLLSGHRLQRKEFQQLIKRLKGKLCRDSHQWSYQATHCIIPDPIRRTEKFFAAAAAGRWILKTDYLTASSHAGKFLSEEPYEWHKNGLSEDGAINLEAPRKWRALREKTGHGALYGMRIVIYGECIAPPLDTLKRVVKAGDGTILATSPPYTRFLESGIDFAIVSPGMPRVDIWVQEFLRHEIPCVLVDYLVEYVCKPGYPLDRHVQYNTHEWAAKSFSRLSNLSKECITDATTPENQVSDDLACQVCGSSSRAEVMLVCGNESGSTGCGVGTHIDCCDPPLEDVPEEDWLCPKCCAPENKPPVSTKKKASSKRL